MLPRSVVSLLTLFAALGSGATLAQKLPSVDWVPAGRVGGMVVEYTVAGMKRSPAGLVIAFSRTSLVEGLDAARRQRIDALHGSGLSAQGYERYLRQVRLSEYDCEGRRVRALTVTDYDDAGRVLAWASAEGQDAAWTVVPPQSIGAKLLDAVCRAAPAS